MTFDEFLLSENTTYNFKSGADRDKSIIKIKYNDNIEFLYIPSYLNFEIGSKLEFIGVFDRNTRKLYGDSFYLKGEYYKEIYSSLFECTVSQIYERVVDGANDLLNKYIKDNEVKLMNLSKNLFDKYISFENNYKEIEQGAITDYIYNNENEIKFSVDSYRYENESNNIKMQYIQNPQKTVENFYKQYIDNPQKEKSLRWYEGNNPYYQVSVNEYIGVRLNEQKLYEDLLNKIKLEPNDELRKKYEIIQSIKNIDAQMLTITIKHNDNEITFKYPKETLYRLEFYDTRISNPNIREQIEHLYKNMYGYEKDKNFINEISKIEYGRKILYEDNKLLNKEFNIQNSPDIVDDMFE